MAKAKTITGAQAQTENTGINPKTGRRFFVWYQYTTADGFTGLFKGPAELADAGTKLRVAPPKAPKAETPKAAPVQASAGIDYAKLAAAIAVAMKG